MLAGWLTPQAQLERDSACADLQSECVSRLVMIPGIVTAAAKLKVSFLPHLSAPLPGKGFCRQS